MSKTSSQNVRCPRCKTAQSIAIYESVTASRDSILKRKVMEREIFRHRCQNCNVVLELVHPILYHDTEQRLAIWLISTEITAEHQDAMDTFGFTVGGKGYRLRVSRSLDELIEKILIFDSKLNDWLVHLVKLGLEDESQSSTEDMRFVNFRYGARDSSSMTFRLQDKKKEMTIRNIGDELLAGVKRWDQLESKLDWVAVNDANFYRVFELYRKNFGA